jgi:hypothetical protein
MRASSTIRASRSQLLIVYAAALPIEIDFSSAWDHNHSASRGTSPSARRSMS